MCYAVNRKTKVHRPIKRYFLNQAMYGSYVLDIDESFVGADSNGWVQFKGFPHECPVPGGCATVIKTREGHVFRVNCPERLRWTHTGKDTDIVAYKPYIGACSFESNELNWDGNGEPVEGEWCQLIADDEPVEFMVRGRGNKFCGRDKEGYIGIFSLDGICPINSEEYKAIEEMVEIMIPKLIGIISHDTPDKQVVEYLASAARTLYRKGHFKIGGKE